MRYTADLLSLLRIFAAALLVPLTFNGEWKGALIVLTLGWGTDPLDGYAARRWGSLRDRKPDLDLDGIADSVLAFGSTLMITIYTGLTLGWMNRLTITFVSLYILTLVSGVWMVGIMNKPITRINHAIVAFNMTVMHGLVQIIGAFAWFTYKTYGTNAMYVAVMTLLLFGCTQERKIKMWVVEGRLQ